VNILVIANACSDNTKQQLVNYQSNSEHKLALSFSEEPKPGKSYALNHGLDLIQDGFICLIDDDQTVDQFFFTSTQIAINNSPEIMIFLRPASS